MAGVPGPLAADAPDGCVRGRGHEEVVHVARELDPAPFDVGGSKAICVGAGKGVPSFGRLPSESDPVLLRLSGALHDFGTLKDPGIPSVVVRSRTSTHARAHLRRPVESPGSRA